MDMLDLGLLPHGLPGPEPGASAATSSIPSCPICATGTRHISALTVAVPPESSMPAAMTRTVSVRPMPLSPDVR